MEDVLSRAFREPEFGEQVLAIENGTDSMTCAVEDEE